MKILFVAMSNSIHTIRWIRQITGLGWDIHLFVGNDSSTVHPELGKLVDPKHIYCRKEKKKGIFRFLLNISKLISISKNIIFSNLKNRRHVKLRHIINKIKPDVIHSLEIQHAGYLTLSAKDNFNGEFPPWIVTNWGSDIYLFGRLAEHEPKIREVLKQCDYYSCECYRDVELAKKYGFKGKVLPVFPNTGGFDLKVISWMRSIFIRCDSKCIFCSQVIVNYNPFSIIYSLCKNYIFIYLSIIMPTTKALSTNVKVSCITCNTGQSNIITRP